jgi:glyoxylase-like metal-dependent hydrolase (beta-lactamase superfamily II)
LLRGYRSIAYYCAASFWKDDEKYKEDHSGNNDEKPEDSPPAERFRNARRRIKYRLDHPLPQDRRAGRPAPREDDLLSSEESEDRETEGDHKVKVRDQ